MDINKIQELLVRVVHELEYLLNYRHEKAITYRPEFGNVWLCREVVTQNCLVDALQLLCDAIDLPMPEGAAFEGDCVGE